MLIICWNVLVIRKNKYIDMTNLRFKDYLNKKIKFQTNFKIGKFT